MWANNSATTASTMNYIYPAGAHSGAAHRAWNCQQTSQTLPFSLPIPVHPPRPQVITSTAIPLQPGISLPAVATSLPAVVSLKRPRSSLDTADRTQRSRERNKIHARRTRLRKKIHLQNLRDKVEELDEERKGLRRALDDLKTANIMLAMCASPHGCNTQLIDTEVLNDDGDSGMLDRAISTTTQGDSNSIEFDNEDANLSDDSSSRYSEETIRDDLSAMDEGVYSSRTAPQQQVKITEMSSEAETNLEAELCRSLLKKTKDFCTPTELEFVRREKNRLHAKRMREKKKKDLKETEAMISGLTEEIRQLRSSIQKLGTFSLILPTKPPPTEVTGSSIAEAQLLMGVMDETSTQRDSNSEGESYSSLEPGSSSSNGNGSSRSGDDSNSVDDDNNAARTNQGAKAI
mmetsp:Transcript_31526/g.54444  ORF Transcript_31526/g.54444 Transcript_31526/m.54444 type:complete len:404 (-) Transcript_31526:226-1437(-)